jgi:hypothetical protein
MIFYKDMELVGVAAIADNDDSVMNVVCYVKICKGTLNKREAARVDHLGLNRDVKGFPSNAGVDPTSQTQMFHLQDKYI